MPGQVGVEGHADVAGEESALLGHHDVIVADGHEAGTLPEILKSITSRVIVEDLRRTSFPGKFDPPVTKRLKKAGIGGKRDFTKAKKALDDLASFEESAEQRQERELQELRAEVAGVSEGPGRGGG